VEKVPLIKLTEAERTHISTGILKHWILNGSLNVWLHCMNDLIIVPAKSVLT